VKKEDTEDEDETHDENGDRAAVEINSYPR
jgi:hypothetical protein